MVEAESPDTMYVERALERQRYLEFLTHDTLWVLLVTGLGGSGKTDFLGDLERYTPPPPNCKIARLNFETKAQRTDALTVLEQLAWQIKPCCDEQSHKEFKARLKEGRDTLANKHIQILQQARFGDYSQSQGTRLDLTVESNSADIRQQVRLTVMDAFYDQLETFRLPQLVIILDTCEWLDEKEGQEVGEWLKNELLPQIHTRLQDKQCRCSLVIASSMPMTFANIPASARQECNLDKLAETAVDTYLQCLGVQDPSLRQHIYNAITYGHASCVRLLAEIWLKEGPFGLAERAKLHSSFKQKAMEAFFNEHVLKKFQHSPFEELVHYGVLLHSFNQPLLQAVFPEWLPESEVFHRFQKLIRYPYIRRYSHTHYAFIDLVREILVEYIRYQEPKKWQTYHGRAKQELQTTAHPDWHYHALACNEQQGMVDWKQAVDEAYRNSAQERLRGLLEAAHDKTLELTAATCAERAYEQGRFLAFCNQKQDALESYKHALALFQSIQNATGATRVQQAIDALQQE